MLELTNLSLTSGNDDEPIVLIEDLSLQAPPGHFMAVVGSPGSGKTPLLETIAGIRQATEGELEWNGILHDDETRFQPPEIGYVPAFAITHDQLTVDETIEAATRLKVKTKNNAELDNRIDRLLEQVGLANHADKPVHLLSAGQKRRLALAMEIVTGPRLMLCDQLTSGLDAASERSITRLLQSLSRQNGRIVISATCSLSHLDLYDSILVLHQGMVAYHGLPEGLTHYFDVSDTSEIYPKLAKQPAQEWQSSWEKHHQAYQRKLEKRRHELIENGELTLPDETPAPEEVDGSNDSGKPEEQLTKTKKIVREEPGLVKTPGPLSQFSCLLGRRWKIFFRDRRQLRTQLAILLCLPALVALFSTNESSDSGNVPGRYDYAAQTLQQDGMVSANYLVASSTASGIVMLQVILLALMASHNAAREVAGERLLYEKQKLSGIRTGPYLGSKIVFLGSLGLVQSLGMAIFVQLFWKFPDGREAGFLDHTVFLVCTHAAITALCLGISSWIKNAKTSLIVCLYVVGSQLLLSGALLALPWFLHLLIKPFISVYWAWSGSIGSMSPGYRQAIDAATATSIAPVSLCYALLALHIALGLVAAFVGLRRSQWHRA